MSTLIRSSAAFLFIVLFGTFSYAQKNVNPDSCKSARNVSFSEGTLIPLDRSILVKTGYLSSIANTDAAVELRIFGEENLPFAFLKQIRFYKDVLIIDTYQIYKAPTNKSTDHRKDNKEFRSLTFIGTQDGIDFYVKSLRRVSTDKKKLCKLQTKLLKSHITDLPNGSVLDSLAKAKFPEINCYDCGSQLVIELKVGSKLRNFNDMTYRYDQYKKAERTITELKYRRNIFDIITEIENTIDREGTVKR